MTCCWCCISALLNADKVGQLYLVLDSCIVYDCCKAAAFYDIVVQLHHVLLVLLAIFICVVDVMEQLRHAMGVL